MEVKSDFEELVEKVEEREKVSIYDVLRLFPKSEKQINEIYGSVRNIRKLVYLVAVCDFFNNEKESIRVIAENLENISEENGFVELTDFMEFYYKHYRTYENRCKKGIPHKISILESSFDFSSFKPIGKWDTKLSKGRR